MSASGKTPSHLTDIPRSGIYELVDGLGLSQAAARLLKSRAIVLAIWQRRFKRIEEEYGGRGKSKARLDKVAALAGKLAQEIQQLDPAFLAMLAKEKEWLIERPKVFLSTLPQHLEQFSNAAHAFHARLPSRPVGNPVDQHVARSVWHLVDTLREIEIPVLTSGSRGSIKVPNLRGPGGEFVRGWFKLIDPHVAEATLVRLVEAADAMIETPTDLFRREGIELRNTADFIGA